VGKFHLGRLRGVRSRPGVAEVGLSKAGGGEGAVAAKDADLQHGQGPHRGGPDSGQLAA
jgi:hypothetical protein